MRKVLLGVNYGMYLLLPFVGYCFYKTASSYPTSLTIRCDILPATSIREEIQQTIKSLLSQAGNISAFALRALLKKKYPLLEHVRLTYRSLGKLCIHLTTEKPVALVNDIYILTKQGNLLSAKLYAPAAYYTLPSIQTNVAQFTQSQKKDLLDFAQKIQQALSDEYTFTWHDKTRIYAHHKQHPFLQLTLNYTTMQEEGSWKALALLKQRIDCRHQQSAPHKKNPRALWCVDMRYTDRLILSQQRG